MTLTINGVDITPYIAKGGVKWQRADIDGVNAGRVLTGEMVRNRIAIKNRLDITCRPLTLAEASNVLTAIEPEYVTVTYTSPQTGGAITKVMYSNNIPATFLIKDSIGREWWTGIEFPLIEK